MSRQQSGKNKVGEQVESESWAGEGSESQSSLKTLCEDRLRVENARESHAKISSGNWSSEAEGKTCVVANKMYYCIPILNIE